MTSYRFQGQLEIVSSRACLNIAFCQMYDPLSGRFVLNEGGVAGYVDRILCKYHAKWGVQMAGMNVQTRSRYNSPSGII